MRKGQIISSDFIISLVIFLFILAIIIPLYGKILEEQTHNRALGVFETRAFFMAEVLTKTQGSPDSWNETTVQSAGLADADGRINMTKIRRFVRMDPIALKNILGLGTDEFNISLTQHGYPLTTGVAVSPVAYISGQNSTLLAGINNSGLVWDWYAAGTVDTGVDAKNIHAGQADMLMSLLLENSTKYRTVIIEDAGLAASDINITALQKFVQTGGILIVINDPRLIATGFSMQISSDPTGNGIIQDADLVNAPQGSVVAFIGATTTVTNGAGDAALHHIIDSSATGTAYIGSWDYGIGKIYYATSMTGSVEGQSLQDAIQFVGRRAQIMSGSMTTATVEKRAIVLNTPLNGIAQIVMVIGK